MKLSDILAKKRKEDMAGLRNAQRTGTMAQYLHDDLIAAGLNPDDLIFGGNPDLAVGSARTVSSNLKSGLTVIAKHETASGTLSHKPLEQYLDADVVAAAPRPKCPRCAKVVYQMEEILYLEQPWHKACFTCGLTTNIGCKRPLNKGEYEVHTGIAYCNACFSHYFQLGAARGTVLSTEEKKKLLATDVIEVPDINRTSFEVEQIPKMSVAERIAQLQKKTSK